MLRDNYIKIIFALWLIAGILLFSKIIVPKQTWTSIYRSILGSNCPQCSLNPYGSEIKQRKKQIQAAARQYPNIDTQLTVKTTRKNNCWYQYETIINQRKNNSKQSGELETQRIKNYRKAELELEQCQLQMQRIEKEIHAQWKIGQI